MTATVMKTNDLELVEWLVRNRPHKKWRCTLYFKKFIIRLAHLNFEFTKRSKAKFALKSQAQKL